MSIDNEIFKKIRVPHYPKNIKDDNNINKWYLIDSFPKLTKNSYLEYLFKTKNYHSLAELDNFEADTLASINDDVISIILEYLRNYDYVAAIYEDVRPGKEYQERELVFAGPKGTIHIIGGLNISEYEILENHRITSDEQETDNYYRKVVIFPRGISYYLGSIDTTQYTNGMLFKIIEVEIEPRYSSYSEVRKTFSQSQMVDETINNNLPNSGLFSLSILQNIVKACHQQKPLTTNKLLIKTKGKNRHQVVINDQDHSLHYKAADSFLAIQEQFNELVLPLIIQQEKDQIGQPITNDQEAKLVLEKKDKL